MKYVRKPTKPPVVMRQDATRVGKRIFSHSDGLVESGFRLAVVRLAAVRPAVVRFAVIRPAVMSWPLDGVNGGCGWPIRWR